MGNLTIRELATNLNISKEAIYRKVNHSMKEELKSYVFKAEGKTFITDVGQAIILQSLKRETDELVQQSNDIIKEVSNQINNKQKEVNNQINNNQADVINHTNFEYIKHLEKELELLQTRYDNEVNNNKLEREKVQQEREILYKLNQSIIDTFKINQQYQIGQMIADHNKISQTQVIETVEPQTEAKKSFWDIFKRKLQ